MGLIKKQFHIGGMTCVNCQNRIEKRLHHTAGVKEAAVDYNTGTARIIFDSDLISFRDIIAIVDELGYEVVTEQQAQQSDISRMVSILVIIIALYIILQRFGILNLLVPSQLADSKMSYGMLFVVGLITSVHCIAMCGGINLSQCIPRTADESGGSFSAYVPAFLYNLGRVISYTVIGFILGLIGMFAGGTSGAGLSVFVQGIIKIIAGMFMVVMGVNMLGIFPWLRRFNLRMPKFLAIKIGRQKATSSQPLLIGLLNGLMPCGPLQSMQLVALVSGNPIAGALSMLLFSLGTVPLMLGLGSIVSALGKRFAKTVMSIGAVLVVVLGLAMLSQGGSLSGLLSPGSLLFVVIALSIVGVINSVSFSNSTSRLVNIAATLAVVIVASVAWVHFNTNAQSDNVLTDTENVAQVKDGEQVIYSTLSPGSYPDITVQSGIPVKWVIDAPDGSINGCNHKMIIQDYGIEYTFEEGENIVEFTPTEIGTVQYSCWMGMIHGNIFVVNDVDEYAKQENTAEETEEKENTVEVIGADEDIPVKAGYTIPTDELAVGEITNDSEEGDIQTVTIHLTDSGFEPAVVVVQENIQTLWNVIDDRQNAADRTLLIPSYVTQVLLSSGDNPMYLYPDTSFDVSTAEHDFYAYVKVVPDVNAIDEEAIRAEVSSYETMIYPDSIYESSGSGSSCCGSGTATETDSSCCTSGAGSSCCN